MVLDARQFLRALFVHEVDASRIRRISIGDKSEVLLRLRGSDSFGHGNDGGQGFPGVREMVSGEHQVL